MTSPRSSILLKLISILTHTDTIIYIDIYIVTYTLVYICSLIYIYVTDISILHFQISKS